MGGGWGGGGGGGGGKVGYSINTPLLCKGVLTKFVNMNSKSMLPNILTVPR